MLAAKLLFPALALALALPASAQAAVTDITRLAPPQTPDLTVTSPKEANPLTGGGPEIWKVTYRFNDLEYSIPSGGGGQKFTLPDFAPSSCKSGPGALGATSVTCFFPWQAPGYFNLSNTGSIDDIKFTVPESKTWAMIVAGFAALAFLGRKARRQVRVAEAT